MFASALGITADDAEELRQVLLANAADADVTKTANDEFGERYVLDFNVARGQVGTVVEQLSPDVYEVEFSDDRGQTYASLAVESSRLLGLLYETASPTD